MLFNSLDFFIFLAVVLSLYFVLPLRARQGLLVIASFYFYMYWNVKYASILVFFIFVDFFAGYYIGRASTQARKKAGLILSLCSNLGFLAVFKYYHFFTGTLHDIGLLQSAPALELLLPLGISFHTFQTMSYTIDVYRGVIEPETSLLRFALFVSFFPQLVAGPIERAKELLPQLRERFAFDVDNLAAGGQQILNGFVKKVVLADNLGPWVSQVYAAPGEFSGLSLLLATYMFAWQIYLDFSGYSDIAIGTARVMGFHFSPNFDMPYISASIQDFWRRWHISLSTWLRDYLYIPLGGNRRGSARTYVNLLLTMLLGGLWHGASWNFVIWGGLHGAWLAMEKLVRSIKKTPSWVFGLSGFRLSRNFRRVLVFNGVCFAWIFFRAATLHDAALIIGRVFAWSPGLSIVQDFTFFKFLLIMCLGGGYFALIKQAMLKPRALAWAASTLGVLLVILFGAEGKEFIYFVF
jgi:D-alanyl-lipoteichoic acid acyltransferase DltB (MBOAT superfamily)